MSGGHLCKAEAPTEPTGETQTLWSGQGQTALAECEAEPHGNPFCLRKRTGKVNFVQPKGCAKEGNLFKREVSLKRFADNRKSK